jgi:hypothetical protein
MPDSGTVCFSTPPDPSRIADALVSEKGQQIEGVNDHARPRSTPGGCQAFEAQLGYAIGICRMQSLITPARNLLNISPKRKQGRPSLTLRAGEALSRRRNSLQEFTTQTYVLATA